MSDFPMSVAVDQSTNESNINCKRSIRVIVISLKCAAVSLLQCNLQNKIKKNTNDIIL